MQEVKAGGIDTPETGQIFPQKENPIARFIKQGESRRPTARALPNLVLKFCFGHI